MKKLLTPHLVATVIFSIAVTLSWVWFSWKLPLVIALFLWANNIEQTEKLKPALKKLHNKISYLIARVSGGGEWG